jgi:uncharacterized protein
MRFAPDKDFGSYTVRSYQAGQVNIIPPMDPAEKIPQPDDLIVTRSFIVTPKQLQENWPPQSLAELAEEHLRAVIHFDPELVILGTGRKLDFPHPSLTEPLFSRNIGVEIMDTAAACRTYNVLVHEGREVVAAIIID